MKGQARPGEDLGQPRQRVTLASAWRNGSRNRSTTYRWVSVRGARGARRGRGDRQGGEGA